MDTTHSLATTAAGMCLVQLRFTTDGRKTHLKARNSQLRQTVHVRTQDFMFPNLQGLPAPFRHTPGEERNQTL